jgi:hypothetical protein
MKLGKVIGTVVATRKDEKLEGLQLFVVQDIAPDLKAKDSFVWHTEPLAAASERELCLLNRLLEGTLRTPAQLALCGDGGVLLFRQLFQLIAHPMAAPRRAASSATKRANSPSPT